MSACLVAKTSVRAAVLAIALLATTLVVPASGAAKEGRGSCVARAGLDGSFLQLTRADAQRPRADWQRLFADMAAVGVKQLFVQWTWADGVAFYTSEPAGQDDAPLLDL